MTLKQYGSPDRRMKGRRWRELRGLVLRARPLCVHCQARGVLREATEVDHRVALANGGGDDFENLDPVCRDCHTIKTRADLGQRTSGCDAAGRPIDPGHHWNAYAPRGTSNDRDPRPAPVPAPARESRQIGWKKLGPR